jgi:carboxyl-terminal processing protease
MQTIAGGPSEKVGVLAGDKIVFIDTTLVAGIGIDNDGVIKRLRGRKGTVVNIRVLRKGEPELLGFRIVRDKIPIFSVEAAYMAAKKTGYIKLARFAATSTEEVKQAIDSLKKAGAKSLILDLTGNTGGYLNQATGLSDLFLGGDKLITYTEGRSQPRQDFKANSGGPFEHGKLVVMTDQGSASASEIVSGAIQDWDRGLIIGRRTYGKGLVQKTYFLPDQSAVRLTMAHYYTPSGRSIQRSYDNGRDEYDNDIQERIASGELYDGEKIHPLDTVKYYTAKKRVVYGGGGITPDIFVAVDTSWRSPYYFALQRNGAFNAFTTEFMDTHRDSLNKAYPDLQNYIAKFEVTDDLLESFFAFAEDREVERGDSISLERSGSLIRLQIKALVARNIFNSSAYYQLINEVDPIFLEARKVIATRRLGKEGVK